MKRTRKYIAALAVLAAGTVFYGSLPAHAKSIELDKVQIVFKDKEQEVRRDMPPRPMPGDGRDFGPGPGGHMPPQPRPGDRRGFEPGPGGQRGHMPPPSPAGDRRDFGPEHREPRGHMPPPRW